MIRAIIDDPIYLAIGLAVIGILGGGAISWLITFAYFKKSQASRLLCYTTRDSDYLGYNRAEFHNLSVHYGSKTLVNPVRYTVYVWNCGNSTLNKSDTSTIDPLAFGRSDVEILEVAPAWTTRESINLKTTLDASKNKIFVDFDFLDPNDGFAIQFLADRPNQTPRWANIQAYGTLKGLNRAPFRVSASFTSSSWWTKYIALAAILFFAFSTISIGYDAWLSGMTVTSLAKILATVIFGLITLGIFAGSLEGFGDGSYVIPNLLRKHDDIDDTRTLYRRLDTELAAQKTSLDALSVSLESKKPNN